MRGAHALRGRTLLLALFVAAACGLGLGCRVTPPSPREVLDVNFRTPEAAFQSFRIGSRADLPDLEFRCLSAGFRRRNGISKLAYLEFREQWLKDEPLVRWAIDRAKVTSVERLREDRAIVQARTVGRTLELLMVREDFTAVSTEEGLADSRDIDFDANTGEQEGATGDPWMWARMPLPAGVPRDEVTEFSVRREWRIDDFRMVESKGDAEDDAHRHSTPRPE